jgi:eukaryotic-like serine/threonine-protein kinase
MPQRGQMLGDRYRLDDRIAAGGMGEVWQATDTVLGRDVAVKTLKGDHAGDPSFQNRFQHEARAMAVLHHPGVADVYDYGQTTDGGDAYIVMARVRGEPLNQLIAERGRLTPVETMSIVAQAARALEAAHQAGIVHRDVKPSNLIVQPDGTVVLVDFGVARSAQSAALTGAKEVVGTALYIAPEQVSKQTTGPSADVYALGAVAYHCLTGHPPFVGNNPIAVAMQHLKDPPPALPGDIPEPVRLLVETALAKDPAQRFSSAASMAEAADAARGLLSGPSDSTVALAAAVDATRLATASAAGIRTSGAGGFAAGSATVPVSRSDTSVMPAPLADPPPPRNRRRALLIVAGLMILLLAVLAAIAFASKGGGDGDKDTPAPPVSVPASVKPSARTNPGGGQQQTGGGSSSHHTTEPTKGSPQTSSTRDETTEPTAKPSKTPTTESTTKQTPTGNPTTGAGTEPPETNDAVATTAGTDDTTAVAVATPQS